MIKITEQRSSETSVLLEDQTEKLSTQPENKADSDNNPKFELEHYLEWWWDSDDPDR